MELLLDNIQRYFDFCKERHSIYIKKSRGDSWPWTDDIILQTYKFTCVYRQLDKGTLWLTENIIKPYSAHPYLFFNVALYRRYNYWPMAQAILDEYKLLDNPRKIKELPFFVRAYKDKGNQVFTGAHMINCAKPCKDKIEYIFDVGAKDLWAKRLDVEPTGNDNLESAFYKLRTIPGFGDFITYEVITDLWHTRYLEHANDIMTWANPGPGATRGIMRLANMPVKGKKPKRDDCIEVMKYLLGMSLEYLPNWMPLWEMRTCEHSLCEYDKYERVRLGEGRPRAKYHVKE